MESSMSDSSASLLAMLQGKSSPAPNSRPQPERNPSLEAMLSDASNAPRASPATQQQQQNRDNLLSIFSKSSPAMPQQQAPATKAYNPFTFQVSPPGTPKQASTPTGNPSQGTLLLEQLLQASAPSTPVAEAPKAMPQPTSSPLKPKEEPIPSPAVPKDLTSMFNFTSPFDLLSRGVPSAPASAAPATQQASSSGTAIPKKESAEASPVPEPEALAKPSAPTSPQSKAQTDLPSTDLDSYLAKHKLPISQPESFSGKQLSTTKTSFNINTSLSLDYTLSATPLLTPITLFETINAYQNGRRVVVCGGLISYATKQGRLRVLDRKSGARLLLKGHNGPVFDFGLKEVGAKKVRLVSASSDGTCIVWEIPSEFQRDHPPFSMIMRVQIPDTTMHTVRFHPTKSDVLFVATNDHRIAAISIKTQDNKSEAPAQADQLASKTLSPNQGSSDFAISRDGSVLAVLDDGQLRLLDAQTMDEVSSFFCLESSSESNAKLNLLEDEDGHPAGVAVASDAATKLKVFSLSGKLMHHLEMSRPAKEVPQEAFYNFIAYDAKLNLLLWSNTLRGSVFCLHVALPHQPQSSNAKATSTSDLAFIQAYLTNKTEQPDTAASHPKIDRILELPSPKPVISFAPSLDSEPSLFCMAPDGISEVHLPSELLSNMVHEAERLSRVETEEKIRSEETKKVDLKDRILVEKETAVASDHEDVSNVIKKMGRKKGKEVIPEPVEQKENIPPVVADSKKPEANTQSQQDDLAQKFKALEDSLTAKMSEQIDEQSKSLQKAIAQQSMGEIKRQEDLLALVSNTLGKQTSKALGEAVKTAVRDTMIPSITKIMRESINEEIGDAMRHAMHKALPEAMAVLLTEQDSVSSLAATLSATTSPIVHQVVSDGLKNVTEQLTRHVTREMNKEMISIRKELVLENNTALAALTTEMRSLSEAVAQLKASPPAPAVEPRSSSREIYNSNHAPVPERPQTPQEQYEDILLMVLSSADQTQLENYTRDAPSHRLDAIFSRDRTTGKPVVSQTVLLSLAHRLVEHLPQRQGTIDQKEAVYLRWFVACVAHFDYNDPTTRDYVPRILQIAGRALSGTILRCNAAKDGAGMRQVEHAMALIQRKLEQPR